MIFDHTTLSHLACEEEFVRRHRDNYASPRESSAQRIGRAIHAGVRAYYAGGNDITVEEAAAAVWRERESSDWRTLILAQAYTRMYCEVYPRPWPFEVLHNEGYLESGEVAGIPDRIVRRPDQWGIVPLELKTTSLFVGEAWQAQWAHSQQAAIQLDLAEQTFKVECGGFWMDAIYLSSRKAGPKPEDFVRCGPFAYSLALRAELRQAAARRTLRATELLTGVGLPAAKNPNACMRYNSLCTFYRYCCLDPKDRGDAYALALATGELVVKPWNPKDRP